MADIEKYELFSKWIQQIQYYLQINEILQPVGLDLSCLNIVLETDDDYSFKSAYPTEEALEDAPLAWFNPTDETVHIFIDHPIWKVKYSTDAKKAFLTFLLCHEAEHRLLLHHNRGKEYNHDLFNIAGDMELHNMMYIYNALLEDQQFLRDRELKRFFNNYISNMLFNKNPNDDKSKDHDTALNAKWSGLWEKDYLDLTAEEIYAELNNNKSVTQKSIKLNCSGSSGESQDSGDSQDSEEAGEDKNKNGNSNSQSQDCGEVTITTTTYTSKSGQKFTTVNVEYKDNNGNGNAQSKESGAMARATLAKTIIQKALEKQLNEEDKGRGTLSAACQTFLKKLLKVKIDWKKILRNSLVTALEKDEYFSWAKPRTSLFGLDTSIYLPDQIESESAYGTLIVARDESGSMSDEDCQKAASIIKESKDYYKKVVILKHDTEISTVDVLEDDISDLDTKMLLTRTADGGTSHEKVFEFIRDYNKKSEEEGERVSACIFITDMQSDIEQTQDIAPEYIPRIWLVPKSCISMGVDKMLGQVSGKLIAIE